jgi:hypothetical protein
MREIKISGAGGADLEDFLRERILIKTAGGLKKEEGEHEKGPDVYGYIEQINLALKAESEEWDSLMRRPFFSSLI